MKKHIIIFLTTIILCGYLTEVASFKYFWKNVYAEETDQEEDSETLQDFYFTEYKTSMKEGEQQTIVVNKSDEMQEETIIFSSSNEETASIDEEGTVCALKEGTTDIIAKCGEHEISFTLQVEKEEVIISVEDIKIEDYQSQLYVGETETIEATIEPENATDAEITYKSSDSNVASVSSSGEIKGISKGSATITVKAGEIKKYLDITVLVKTTAIFTDTDYLVLSEGEGHQLEVRAEPNESCQIFTFSSSDSSVATVSDTGYIKACKNGNAMIVVSNSEYLENISVIVNRKISESNENDVSEKTETEEEYGNVIDASSVKKITQSMLRYFYSCKSTVTVNGEKYSISFKGEDIQNFENEFDTDLYIQKTELGTVFIVNPQNNLFGTISIEIEDSNGKRLYIYNDEKEEYEYLGIVNDSIKISVEGKYLITDSKLAEVDEFMIAIYIATGIVVISLIIFYIFKTKKYWFW